MPTIPALTELSLLVCTASKRRSLTLLRQIITALAQYPPEEGKWAIAQAPNYLKGQDKDWLEAALRHLEKNFENGWTMPFTAYLWVADGSRVALRQTVTARFTAWDYQRLTDRAESSGVSRGEFARQALTEFIDNPNLRELKSPDLGSSLVKPLGCRISRAYSGELGRICRDANVLKSDVLRIAVLSALVV